MIFRPLLLLCLLLSAGPPADPRGGPPDWPTPHLGELEQIRLEARERNAVLALFVIQEGEEANDRFREGVYKNREVVRACRDLIVLLVNDGKHASKTVREKKGDEVREREICSVFGTPRCTDHSRYFHRVFQEYNEKGVMRTPQLLLILPDGKIHRRLIDEQKSEEIVRRIEEARKIAGPSLTGEQLREIKKALSSGRAAGNRGRHAEAWRCWTRVLQLSPGGMHEAEATAGQEDAVAGMRGEIGGAKALLDEGRITAGYARLLELNKTFAGTPVAKEADRAVRDAEKNKEWKEEIEAYQREVEAREIWGRVRDLLAQDKRRTAERFAKRILSRYPDTEAAELVRKTFPDLDKENG
jgi:hypothetical protein